MRDRLDRQRRAGGLPEPPVGFGAVSLRKAPMMDEAPTSVAGQVDRALGVAVQIVASTGRLAVAIGLGMEAQARHEPAANENISGNLDAVLDVLTGVAASLDDLEKKVGV